MFQLVLLLALSTLSICVLGQYHYIAQNKTWPEAQRYCRENYFDLVRIDNADEQQALMKSFNITNSKTWIGQYDDPNSWTWSLNDDAFYTEGQRNFRNWYIQKPTYWYEQNVCAYLSVFDASWYAIPCDIKLPFVCFDGRQNVSDQFILIDQLMNWTDAQRYCRDHYTDLAIVRNMTENQMIRLLYFDNTLSYIYYGVTWIGLYRSRSWSDKSNFSFSNWQPGQPNNYGQSGFCVAASFNDSGRWRVEYCNQTFPFICYNETSPVKYHFVNQSRNWTEAQRYCRQNYTDLVTINNMEEMMRLVNTVNSTYSGVAWIGLYEDLNNWRWSLNDDAFFQEWEKEFRAWPQEPNNLIGKEYCVKFNGHDGTWSDENCEYNISFICYDGKNKTSHYIRINQYLNWTEAQRYCRQHYTDLASVRNQTENKQLQNILGYYSGWIGLYRPKVWSDKHTAVYQNWKPATRFKPQEPDNGFYYNYYYYYYYYDNDFLARGNQLCTAVSFTDSGQWTDEDCLNKMPFVCYRLCNGSSCSSPYQYHFINQNKTWTEAQRYCRVNYTDLATINKMEEMNRLFNTTNWNYSTLVWIGLYDDLNSWKWSLNDDASFSNEKINFTNWYVETPRNQTETNLCVVFTNNGAWVNTSCLDYNPFICFDGKANATEPFVLVSQYMNWNDAQRYCREHYTDLASIRNESENEQIRSLIPNHYYYFFYYYGYSVWIGLYRTRTWSDKSNSSFSNWQPGQPDNFGESENCTAASFKNSGQWRDEQCNNSFPFICYSSVSSSGYRQYHFVNKTMTWTEAQIYCRNNYSDLATIINTDDMIRFVSTVNGSYFGLAWIGLYDGQESWKWSLENGSFYKDGEKDFRAWPHQPDNLRGAEYCGYMELTGKWYDGRCKERKEFVCFNGLNNSYVRIVEPRSWKDAQMFCRQKYTDLASVRNETELQRVLSVVNRYPVWIGLYRNPVWSDQSNSTFTNWRALVLPTDEPDNGYYSLTHFGEQHCTAIDASGQWSDEYCLESFPFICYSGAVMGLRMNVKSDGSLLDSDIEGFLVMQLQQELNKYGISAGNFSVSVRNIRKINP